MSTDGRPRGLLAHADFGKGLNSVTNKTPLANAGSMLTALSSPSNITKPGGNFGTRNTSVNMVGHNTELLGTGRYGVSV